MVLNPFLHWFTMDFFDERILTMLSDGKPKVFLQLLDGMDFSKNTLKLHLKRLLSQGLVVKEKMPSNGKGRPRYAYSIPPRIRQQVSAALQDPAITIVTLPFSRLRHLCRFEKADTANKLEKTAAQKTALKFLKLRNKNHF